MITKASVVTVGATNRSQSGKTLKDRFLEKTGIETSCQARAASSGPSTIRGFARMGGGEVEGFPGEAGGSSPPPRTSSCVAGTMRSLAVDQGVEHVYVVSDGSSDRTAEMAR
jgi:hypothetical protein